MKTLNERVYESLLAFDKPVTLSQLNVAEDLKNVPRMALGESLRGLCGEQIVSYRMKNGKIYFSADPKYGECQNPSQKNLQSLSSALGGLAGLASLLGGMNGGTGSFPRASADEEEVEEYSTEWDNITFENGKRIHGEGYSICIPAGCSCVDTDEGHDAVVSYPEGVSEDDELMHMMVGKPNIQNVMAEFPQDLIGTFAELVMWQMHNTVAQGKSPIVTVGNKTKGYLLDADSNYILQLPVPSGIQTLRIDLMNQAPKTLMRRIIGEWLDTYECERDFPGAKPFNDKEYFSKEGIQKFVADVEKAAEYRIRLRQQRDEITERKLECLKAGGYKSATKFIMEERATYQAIADAQSDVLAQMLETVTYYKSLGLTEEEYFKIMWVVQAYLYGLVPMKTIDLPDGNLGAYNSPTDIAISFKQNSGAQIDVGAMPKHYEELFAFASAAIPSGENEAVYRARNSDINHAIRNAYSKNEEQYNADFKMEGSMLAAYLGDSEHVVVPDGTAVISDTAFANCRNLKTVELPEGLTQIGYAAFENCPNLQSIKMPDSITSMFPALFGYDAFGKKKPKFIVYKDSYAEEFAKEHEIPYEVIKEDNLDSVFKYEEGRRDVVAGLSVLVPDGFATSEQLSSTEKRKFKDSEGTSHLYYAAVSADADGKFAEYKNVGASFTIAGMPTEYEDAADEMNVEFILSRLNTPHKNGSYKIETLKKNKLVVAYDMGNSGIENGTPWVMYPVFVFTRKYIIPMQFFFNDHYSDRQHNYAVKQWIMGIIDEDERLEKERKRKQEEERKRKQEEEKKRKEEERKRKEEEAAAVAKRKAEKDALDKPIAERKRKYQYLLKGMMCSCLDNFVCTTEDGVPYEFTDYMFVSDGSPSDISRFSNIKSIVVTNDGIVGLRQNGTCISTDPGFTYSYIKECNTWKEIKQIAAGEHHVIGLREDGTCVSHRIKWNTGYGYDGQCDVSSWSNIKYVTCGDSFTAGLKYDGTVVIAGETDYSRAGKAREWKDIEFIEAYSNGIIAVNKEGKVLHTGRADVSSISSAKNIIDVAVYRGKPYALLADGTLIGEGCSNINDVVALSAGTQLYMLKKDGSITVKGSSFSYRRKAVPNTLRLFKSYDEFIAKIEAEENIKLQERERLIKEKEERQRMHEERMKKAAEYRSQGLCQHCGGTFKKGLFGMKCTSCGQKKDYK